jgi:3-phosphoshikimate 1-carboxyvinyltransferase
MRLSSRPCGPLRGDVRAIGDKSLTHRALILASISSGASRISGANPGEDCRSTARALSSLGATLRPAEGGWEIEGGWERLHDPEEILDLGNSGTGIRLLAGLVAGRSLYAVLTGDASLRRRPMRRIAEPLEKIGAQLFLRRGEFPPIAVRGGNVRAISYRLPFASAQVKSCCLLASLGLRDGEILLQEPGPSRDHTERLLRWLGVDLDWDGRNVRLRAPIPKLEGFAWKVPADISAAAFYIVAATIVPGSEVHLAGVLLNPTRTGCLDVLRRMGADIEIEEDDPSGPEPVGTIHVRSASLHGTVIDGDLLIRALDEVPILAVAAAAAQGETRFLDAAELRVKESDRIESSASLARALGAEVETGGDRLVVLGRGGLRGCAVASHGDHRIAMSAIVAGCAASGPVEVDDASAIDTSDPEFLASLTRLGADLA